MPNKLTVVVTGSSGGLGAATTKRFVRSGYRVVGLDTHPTGSLPNEVEQRSIDVCSDRSVRDAFDGISREGAIIGLVHCAGIANFGPQNPGELLAFPSAEPHDNLAATERTLRTNVLGTFTVVRHAASAIARNGLSIDQGRGFIVLTSSGAAIDGKAGQSAYSASKAAVAGMTLPLSRELSAFGIRVVTIAPGLFDTPILDSTPRVPRHVPFPPRAGDPDEFAALADHIAQNAYLNAEVIRLDGGIRGGFESSTPFVR